MSEEIQTISDTGVRKKNPRWFLSTIWITLSLSRPGATLMNLVSPSPPILSGLGGVASLCPARSCVSLLYSRVAPGLRSYLSPVRECCSCSRTHGGGREGGRGAQALGEFAAPPVRPSVSLSCLLPPFRVLPRASRAVHLPRLPFSLPPPRPRRLLPLSKSPLALHMDTRGRMRLHRRVCASLLCLCLFFPFILREKRRYDTIFGQRDSRETTDSLSGM